MNFKFAENFQHAHLFNDALVNKNIQPIMSECKNMLTYILRETEDMKIIIVEGMPCSGKSSLLNQLEKFKDNLALPRNLKLKKTLCVTEPKQEDHKPGDSLALWDLAKIQQIDTRDTKEDAKEDIAKEDITKDVKEEWKPLKFIYNLEIFNISKTDAIFYKELVQLFLSYAKIYKFFVLLKNHLEKGKLLEYILVERFLFLDIHAFPILAKLPQSYARLVTQPFEEILKRFNIYSYITIGLDDFETPYLRLTKNRSGGKGWFTTRDYQQNLHKLMSEMKVPCKFEFNLPVLFL